LLLPMVYITKCEQELFIKMVLKILKELPFRQDDHTTICSAICENCLME